jgi:hypothetical protein
VLHTRFCFSLKHDWKTGQQTQVSLVREEGWKEGKVGLVAPIGERSTTTTKITTIDLDTKLELSRVDRWTIPSLKMPKEQPGFNGGHGLGFHYLQYYQMHSFLQDA